MSPRSEQPLTRASGDLPGRPERRGRGTIANFAACFVDLLTLNRREPDA